MALRSILGLLLALPWPLHCFRLLPANAGAQEQHIMHTKARAAVQERHIMYTNKNVAGISDRLIIMSRLMWMGWKYNATVHYVYGDSARRALTHKHSRAISEHWSRYLDIPGHCGGRTPFNEVERRFSPCRHIRNPSEDFQHLFEQGESCVSIDNYLYKFRKLFPTTDWATGVNAHDQPPGLKDPTCDVLQAFSPDVRRAADGFLRRYGVRGAFGVFHIRRCDRLYQNRACTSPEAVREKIESTNAARTWLVFSYAEKGYAERLKAALRPLSGTHRILLEDEVQVNAEDPEDNYFTYQIAMRLMAVAKVQVETQGCTYGKSVCR